MQLDTGICSIYKMVDKAAAGRMPDLGPATDPFSEPWYGELAFESNPVNTTELQEDVEISARIRILQDRRVNRQTYIKLVDANLYKVERTFHGLDEESGELITDVSLSRVVSDCENE